MVRQLQPNFAGGILSEGMYGRGDLVKYQVGVADAVNCIIRQQGGLSNRPGFMLAAGADVTGGTGIPPTLIPFQFSADEAYMLEFHGGVFRVLLDGSYVLTGSPITVTGAGANTNPGWAFDTTGLTVGQLLYVTRPGHWMDGQVVRLAEMVAGGARLTFANGGPLDTTGQPTTFAGMTLTRVYQGVHPYAAADLEAVRYAQDADYLYMVHKSYPPFRLRRLGHDNWAGENIVFAPSIGAPFTVVDVPLAITAAQQTSNPIFTIPGHGLSVGQAVIMVDAPNEWRPGWPFRVREVVSASQVRLEDMERRAINSSGYPAIGANAKVKINSAGWVLNTEAPDIHVNAVIERYVVAAMNDAGEEGPASPVVEQFIDLNVQGNRVVITWRPLAGARRYVVYKEVAGAFGYIGATENTFFVDNNIAPDTSQGPQVPRNPFDGPNRYPGVVAFHEQRLFLGSTNDDPQLVEASQTANPLNFAVSYPGRDSDAITFRPKHKQVNAIRALVSGTSLLVLTSGGEWALSGGEDGRPLTPTNLFLRPVSYWGIADIEPALLGDVLLMVQRGGRIARDYRLGGERPSDLTIMAADLFRHATITGWAYCQTPYSILWVVLSDGTLVSLTYNAEHDIWGWTRHEVGGGGAVLRVATILEGDEDMLYAVVKRPRVGGGFLYQTERLARRLDDDPVEPVFLDSARRYYSATPVSAIDGLIHLAGRTVSALVDGNVYHNLTVGPTGGVSIGDRTGRVWIVGIPYRSTIETLPFETETRDEGSTVGAQRLPTSAGILVERTRGLWSGIDPERMHQLKEWAVSGSVEEIPLRTTAHDVMIDGDWLKRPTVIVEQRDPLPFTVLGIAPQWHLGA